MSYQALYRKWRPRTFDEVVGQGHITDVLKNQVTNDRLSHAYLFIGSRGTGKTTCAKILARAVNCLRPVDGNPCNECEACLGIESGAILDVVEMDAASNNGVDNVRALREEAVFAPASVKKRVYIVDEVHMLSNSAFNALLKLLEEPPSHLMFILATTELHKVPATIISRCQRHSFRRIDSESTVRLLSEIAVAEGLTLSDEAAVMLAGLSDGSLRDALSLLDQCAFDDTIDASAVNRAMGLAGRLHTEQLFAFIRDGEVGGASGLFDSLWQDGKSPSSILEELSALIRDMLMLKVAPSGGAGFISAGFDRASSERLSKGVSGDLLMGYLDKIQSALSKMHASRHTRVLAELCVIGLCRQDMSDAPIQTRIAAFEQRLSNLESGAVVVKTEFSDEPEPRLGSAELTEPEPKPELEIFVEPKPETEPVEEPEPEPELLAEPAEESAPEPVTEQALESEPDSEPEQVTESESEQASDSNPGTLAENDVRERLAAKLDEDLGIGDSVMLTDPAQVSIRVVDGDVVFEAANSFVLMRLKTPALGEKVKAIVAELFGCRTDFIERTIATPPDAEDRLQNLTRQFDGIVTIEE